MPIIPTNVLRVVSVISNQRVHLEWEIPQFFERTFYSSDDYFESSIFLFCGATWCISVYSNHNYSVNLLLRKENAPTNIPVSMVTEIKKGNDSVYEPFYTSRLFKKDARWWCASTFPSSKLFQYRDPVAPSGSLTIFLTLCSQDGSSEDVAVEAASQTPSNGSSSLEIRSFTEEITELKEKLAAVNKEIDVYKTEITELKRNLEIAVEYEREIPELKEKLTVANKESDIYKTEITELKRKLEVTNKEKYECEKEIIKLKEKMELANKQKDDDKREITETNEKLTVSNKEKAECEREILELKEKLAMGNKEKEASVINIKNTVQDVKQGATRLPQNLQEFAPDHRECDVKITFVDKEYMVHGSVLSVKSEIFRKMFQQKDGRMNSESTLNITKGDLALFEDFLLFMYTGELENISINTVIALYRIADHYKVEDLKMACVRFLACNMSTEFMIDVQRAIFFRDLAKISNTEPDFLINDNE